MILVPRKESLQCVSTLSEKYWKYKGFYDFPTKWDSKEKEFNKKKRNLRYIKVEFETPTFDIITKDKAAKWQEKLSAIGGTMGLLTGFSIISGVEIGYFIVKTRFRINNVKP